MGITNKKHRANIKRSRKERKLAEKKRLYGVLKALHGPIKVGDRIRVTNPKPVFLTSDWMNVIGVVYEIVDPSPSNPFWDSRFNCRTEGSQIPFWVNHQSSELVLIPKDKDQSDPNNKNSYI